MAERKKSYQNLPAFQQLEVKNFTIKTKRGKKIDVFPYHNPILIALNYDADYRSDDQVTKDVLSFLEKMLSSEPKGNAGVIVGYIIGMGHEINPKDIKSGVLYPVQFYCQNPKRKLSR